MQICKLNRSIRRAGPALRTFAAAILSCFLTLLALPLLSPPAASDTLSDEALEAMENGIFAMQSGDSQDAFNHIMEAWRDASEIEYGEIPPGLFFNTALIHDMRPGRQLAAILWYEAFSNRVPESDLTEAVRRRISVLLREFDALQVARIEFTRKIFTHLAERQSEREFAYSENTDSSLHEQLAFDKEWINRAIGRAAAAQVILGNTEAAFDLLEEFGLRESPGEDMILALFLMGEGFYAEPHVDSDVEMFEMMSIIAEIRESTALDCEDGNSLARMANYAYSAEDHYYGNDGVPDTAIGLELKDLRADLESPEGRELMVSGFGGEHVEVHDYTLHTQSLYELSKLRWLYRVHRELCG